MIGAGERVGNTTPPSVALLAYAAAEIGLVLAAAPAVSRLLTRPRWWRPVTRLTPAVMLVYLTLLSGRSLTHCCCPRAAPARAEPPAPGWRATPASPPRPAPQ